MPSFVTTLLVITLVLILLPEVHAFGAGDIPDFSYLNGKAFRHGDIENILLELSKSAGHAGGGGGLLGMASSLFNSATRGKKFDKDDVKHVYFGNWLRDYSQAMDIGGLSKLSADTLLLIVSVLGFLTFGFATEEFEVTADRLGVYLPVEHIDNPKGYAAKEGDARRFHPRLRPPVDPRELQIDARTGMKNYMATEGRGWDTSTAFIRRTFRGCIDYGRRSRGKEGKDLWEAFRLLGQGLHTLEDFTAHSNWCEIALRKMGHQEVFCHVGDNVFVNSPNGRCPPIVTGTFGGADFLHSLMGEATDHISQSSVTALSEKMKNTDTSSPNQLKSILSQFKNIGGGNDDGAQINQVNDFEAKSKAYRFDPNNVMPREVQNQLVTLLKWHDDVLREVIEMMEMIPGLSDLIDKLSNALSAYVYTVIAPYVTPLLTEVTTVLTEGSKEVIDSEEQYEVFDNANASDPTHSVLSKDHFSIILNEPAGKVAQVVVTNAVNLIVPAWFNNEDPDRVIDQILEAFHHPYYTSGQSQIQNTMLDVMGQWIRSQDDQSQILRSLSKESVRAGRNKREGSESATDANYGRPSRSGYGGGYAQEGQGQEYGARGSDINYRGKNEYGGQAIGYDSSPSYGKDPLYGAETQQPVYGSGRDSRYGETRELPSYGKDPLYGAEIQQPVYGSGRDSRYVETREVPYESRHGASAGIMGHSHQTHREDSSRDDRTGYNYGKIAELVTAPHRFDSGVTQHQSHNEESGHKHSRRADWDSGQSENTYGRGTERQAYDNENIYRSNIPAQTSSYAPSYQSEGVYEEERTTYAPSYVSGYEAEQYGDRQEYNTIQTRTSYQSGGYQEQGSTYAPSYQPGGYERGGDDSYARRERREGGYESEHDHRKRETHHEGHKEHHSEEHRHGHHEGHGRDEHYNQETFGAERLSLYEDEGEREHKHEHRKEHGHHHERRY